MSTWCPQHFLKLGEEIKIPKPILDAAISSANSITKINPNVYPVLTLKHLSFLSQTNYLYLRSVVNRTCLNPYRCFKIQKQIKTVDFKRFRIICVPSNQLFLAQQWISKNILNHAKSLVSKESKAFVPGSTLLKAAELHCNKRWLIKLDILSFFESITEISVYRVFKKLGFQPLVSFELARICTHTGSKTSKTKTSGWRLKNQGKYKFYNNGNFEYMGHLPQGAPTSPMLSNMVAYELDQDISLLAKRNDMEFSRYADDIVLSTSRKDFSRTHAVEVVRQVYDILKLYGFVPNSTKTHIVPPRARKVVLGLLVNGDKPRLLPEFKKSMRMHIYYLKSPNHGPKVHASKRGFDSITGLKNRLYGLVSYARQIEPDYGDLLKLKLDRVNWPI